MRLLFAGLLLLVSFVAQAQSPCPAAPLPPGCSTSPSGPNAARLCWEHDGEAADGSIITLSGFKAYYGLNGALTSSQSISGGATRDFLLTGLPPGLHTFSVAAMSGTIESEKSCTVTKLVAGVVSQPAPTPPRVTSTRIEAAEWTCRDASGAVLTSHTRADKAQEECTNRALANPGAVYEIRPSGYRIVVQ